MRLGRLVQRVPAADPDRQPALADPAEQVAGPPEQFFPGSHVVRQRRPGDEQRPGRVEPLQVERWHRPAGRAVQHQVPAPPQRGQAGFERGLPDAVVHHGRPAAVRAAAGHPAHHVAEVLVAGHEVRACLLGQLRLGRAGGGGHHDAAAHLDQLGEQQADPARGRVHHHRVVLADREGAVAQVVRGHALQQHGRGRGQVDAVRHRYRRRRGQHGLVRIAAGRPGPGDPVAHREPGPGPGGGDRAGPLLAEHERQLAGVRVTAFPGVDVGEVDAGRGHVHQQLPRPWLGGRDVFDLEYLGAAVLAHHHCAHEIILSCARGDVSGLG